ncbi:MAG TPA: S-layer homology domain-containing protein, partial [Anaerolineales bacterium]|nr:S-layer homology domain-containing protein [Anaerolineales bacterium]
VFLLKSEHGAPYSPLDASGTFSDTLGHWAEDWIERLALEGITSGCGNGMYCPENPVTRAQMAVFLVRTFQLP